MTEASAPFRPGSVITRREVLHDHPWLEHPVTVVADDGTTLAVRLDPGSRFSFFPEHPFGPRDGLRTPFVRNRP